MPIFSRPGCAICFVHVPKCGGTSIIHRFNELGWRIDFFDESQRTQISRVRRNSPQHCSIFQLNAIFDTTKFDFVFSIVRNPFSRIISEFKFQRKLGWTNLDFQNWVEMALDLSEINPNVYDNHLLPATEFLDDQVYVYRLEDQIDKLIYSVSQHAPRFHNFPRMNTSDSLCSDDFKFNKSVEGKIRKKFAKDFEIYYQDVV